MSSVCTHVRTRTELLQSLRIEKGVTSTQCLFTGCNPHIESTPNQSEAFATLPPTVICHDDDKSYYPASLHDNCGTRSDDPAAPTPESWTLSRTLLVPDIHRWVRGENLQTPCIYNGRSQRLHSLVPDSITYERPKGSICCVFSRHSSIGLGPNDEVS